MTDTTRSTVMITGGSSGIGLALAREFARAGYQLVLVARDAKRLDEQVLTLGMQVQVPIIAIAMDLSQSGSAQELVDELERRDLQLSVLVNNAGVGSYGAFAESDLAGQLSLMSLNMGTLCALTRLVLPSMIARRHGRILNVASTAAFQPGPLMAVYFASKAFVLSFSEALANELAGSGVSVTCLCPGATITGFSQRAGIAMVDSYKNVAMDSDSVARAGFTACMQGRSLVIPGFVNRFLSSMVRFVPRRMATAVTRSILEKGRPPH
jgi:short-subunit dehydrogenase